MQTILTDLQDAAATVARWLDRDLREEVLLSTLHTSIRQLGTALRAPGYVCSGMDGRASEFLVRCTTLRDGADYRLLASSDEDARASARLRWQFHHPADRDIATSVLHYSAAGPDLSQWMTPTANFGPALSLTDWATSIKERRRVARDAALAAEIRWVVNGWDNDSIAVTGSLTMWNALAALAGTIDDLTDWELIDRLLGALDADR